MKKDFAAIATEYARDVVNGKEVACKWARLACKRHLDDLDRAAAGWDYEYNPELTDRKGIKYRPAQRICEFAELMPHTKGEWAADGKLIELERWQIFILAVGFGWILTATGKRRFQEINLFVPRKNAKSTIAAVIGLFMLAADDEFGAEVYTGATSKKQAFEVFTPAKLMALATPAYRSYYGVLPSATNLSVGDTNSKMEPVIGKPGDGASPSCAIIDEYHEHDTDALVDTMETGMGARSQPILLIITTAGVNIGGPCYQHQKALQKILEGTEKDETKFGIIFTIDDGIDWTSDLALKMANPNYGVSVGYEYLAKRQAAAVRDPRKQAIFKTKHLNVWVASASPWINLENLLKCGDRTLKLQDFIGESAYAGLDLASKVDIASRVLEFMREIDGVKHYYVFSRNYIPEARVQMPENSHYQGWVEQQYLTQTPGNMIDLEQIQEDLLKDAEKIQLQEVGKDPYGGQQLGANLQKEDIEVVDVPQRVNHLSEPMKDISALIDAGRFHHDGNLAFEWMLSNVEVKPDNNDNWFPRKQDPTRKIDAAIALIVSHGRAMVGNVADDESPEIMIL